MQKPPTNTNKPTSFPLTFGLGGAKQDIISIIFAYMKKIR